MAKKIKNPKLMKSDAKVKKNPEKNAFNNFAKQVQVAKQKKIEKMGDTKQRLITNKRNNKVLKLGSLKDSKKLNRFALLDEEQQEGGLTHKGQLLKDVKHFNDMDFHDEDEMSDLYEQQDQLNFGGFEEQQQQGETEKRPKNKNEIYKQIIQKSKQHKRQRQEQYEQNFNTAVELDEGFQDLISKLKVRTSSIKLRETLANKSTKQALEYDRLMNELRDDERVVANKVIENGKKGTEKIKKKKNDQINKLMKNSDDEEDIRGWVNNISQSEEQNEEEDEIDDVQLSSEEESEQEGEEESENLEEQDQDQQDQDQQDQENEQIEQQEEDEQEVVEDESSSPLPVIKPKKRQRK